MSNGSNDINSLFAEAAEKLRREAYAAGWRDAIAALTRAAEVADIGDSEGVTPIDLGGGSGSVPSGITQGSTPWYVYQAVRKKPGMTGSEVVSVVTESGHRVSDASIRTSLIRLERKKLIVSRHKKWFPA